MNSVEEIQNATEGRLIVEGDILEDNQGQQEGNRNTDDRNPVRAGAPDLLTEESGNNRADQAGQWNPEINRFHAHPFNSLMSSTLIDRRLRNNTTRIASPIAASAAATVRIKNTNT